MGNIISKIYVGTNQVRPVQEPEPRTPGANTLAYYPLKSDFSDHSGNNNSDIVPSDSSSQIGTYHGVQCFNMNNHYSTISTISNMNNKGTYTWSLWGYLSTSVNGYISFDIMFRQSVDNRGAQGLQIDRGTTCRWRYGNPTNKYTTFTNPTGDARHHIAITKSGGACDIYVDGVRVGGLSSGAGSAIYNATPLVVGGAYTYEQRGDGCLSEFIIDGVAWTAQEVLDYYNTTKGNYGL